ncbi:hypothetical protein [Glycomyces xiaoerkulensis]|uniref:hypothetical protein n=1 Tax=Glycomyces xiaoerkulensis TaxID=2038139 RepID=UPI0012FFEC7F|nr:hypothetical protein [Glycomyces xiaoerkulensis]
MGDKMPDDTQSHDPGAIRDVADSDLHEAATNLADSRVGFSGAQDLIATATQSSGGGGGFFGGAGFDPFSGIKPKLEDVSKAIVSGSVESQRNIENTIEGLRKTAEQYEADEADSVAELDSLQDGQ